MKRNKIYIILIFLLSSSLACDVTELILVPKQINILAHSLVERTIPIKGNVFSITLYLTKEELLEDLELPEDSKFEKVNINKISFKAIGNDANAARQITWDAFFLDYSDGSKKYWVNKHSGLITDGSTGTGFTNVTGKNSEGMAQFGARISELIAENDIDLLEFTIESNYPDQEYLDIEFSLQLDLDLVISYCGMVPGTSDLEDCE